MLTAEITKPVYFNRYGYYTNIRFSDGKVCRVRAEPLDNNDHGAALALTIWRPSGKTNWYGKATEIKDNNYSAARIDAILAVMRPHLRNAQIDYVLSVILEAIERHREAIEARQARWMRDASPALYAALAQWRQFASDNGYATDPAAPGYVSFLAETLAALDLAENGDQS